MNENKEIKKSAAKPKKSTAEKYGDDLYECVDIQDVIDYVQRKAKLKRVYFDDSRAWALYSTEKPAAEKTPGVCRKYGAYRDYLGGGVRGVMCCNLTGDLNDLFVLALKRIESIYNGDGAINCETWEQATGVLL